jgi:L-amino acid N-acyltransferase YncA
MPPTIRDADPGRDAAACAAIYAPYVTDSVISFEALPPTPEEMTRRMDAALLWLVATDGGDAGAVTGYAYATRHRERAAYRWAADVSVYVHRDRHRAGTGRALYAHLLDRLRAAGYRQALGGITLPNPGSEGLHAAFGFLPVARYPRIGFKFGAWHDVGWYQLALQPDTGGTPAEPHDPAASRQEQPPAPPSPDAPVTGGCLCGAVRYEITLPFRRANVCHCSRCRRHSGGAGLVQGRVARDGFRLLRGAEDVAVYRPDDAHMAKAFCRACGSSLFGGTWPEGPEISVRFGTLDGDPGIRPQYHSYAADTAPWDTLPDDGLPRHPAGPPGR